MKLLITAGPTREPIDAVRFISNRSSGRMGAALAEAAIAAGHEVTLLMGPALMAADLADRCTVHRFNTTAELEKLLNEHFRGCDVLVMAAAVADYRPRTAAGREKLPRQAEGLTIQLEPTPDLVAAVAAHKRPDQRIIAFALEPSSELEQRARVKLQRKKVDAIVANALGAMESTGVEAVLLTADGGRHAPGPMSKVDFARWLIGRLETL